MATTRPARRDSAPTRRRAADGRARKIDNSRTPPRRCRRPLGVADRRSGGLHSLLTSRLVDRIDHLLRVRVASLTGNLPDGPLSERMAFLFELPRKHIAFRYLYVMVQLFACTVFLSHNINTPAYFLLMECIELITARYVCFFVPLLGVIFAGESLPVRSSICHESVRSSKPSPSGSVVMTMVANDWREMVAGDGGAYG